MIELHGLGYSYRGASESALKDVHLSVPQGDVTVVAGESGSGKTTLLRLVAGFLVPSDGTIRINGELMSRARAVVAPEDRQVGVVFQDFALFPHLTVAQNVSFGLTGSQRSSRSSRVNECLRLLGIESLAARYPHELSGGQAQRVAIARALAPSPRILVMDEPFNNLNVALRHELVPMVAGVLRSTGITAIVVTHDPHEAYELADRMVLLKDGVMEQAGRPVELYEDPATRYVAHFFGPVNEIPPGSPLSAQLRQTKFPRLSDGTIIVRPECISLATAETELTPGVVRRARFAGDHLIVEIAGEWAGTLRAHLPKGSVREGERVGLNIDSKMPA